MKEFIYKHGRIGHDRIYDILKRCDDNFLPSSLSLIVNLKDYSEKLSQKAEHMYVLNEDKIIGFIGCYMNTKNAFISIICVDSEFQKRGLSLHLLDACIKRAKYHGCIDIMAEVNTANDPSANMFKRAGFSLYKKEKGSNFFRMGI